MRTILGPELGPRLKSIWGLDPEGEIQGAWHDISIPRAWCMMDERTFLPFSFRVSIPNVSVGVSLIARTCGSADIVSRDAHTFI
jgi:hypothetical protein